MEKLNGSIKFTKICDEWLLFKRPRVKESTYSNYKFTIDRYLKVDFRQAVLESLVDYDFNLYIEKLQKKLASKTIRKLGIILKSILRYAERKYDYDFKLDLMSLPSIEQKEIEIFNDKERLKLERKILKTREIKELGILTSLYSLSWVKGRKR